MQSWTVEHLELAVKAEAEKVSANVLRASPGFQGHLKVLLLNLTVGM